LSGTSALERESLDWRRFRLRIEQKKKILSQGAQRRWKEKKQVNEAVVLMNLSDSTMAWTAMRNFGDSLLGGGAALGHGLVDKLNEMREDWLLPIERGSTQPTPNEPPAFVGFKEY
jgi:hypothetical protein